MTVLSFLGRILEIVFVASVFVVCALAIIFTIRPELLPAFFVLVEFVQAGFFSAG